MADEDQEPVVEEPVKTVGVAKVKSPDERIKPS